MLLHQFHPFNKNFVFVWWRELAVAFFLLVGLAMGGLPPFLHRTPGNTLFFELFIKELFLAVVIGGIFWYIQQLRPKPERLQEFFFLNSQPLSHSQIALHFLAKDILSTGWLPGMTVFLLFALANVAPLPHIVRVGIFILLLYVTLIIWSSAAHFATSSRKYNPLSTLNPLIVFATFSLYLIFTLWAILVHSALSGCSFWLIVLLVFFIDILSIWLYLIIFARWQRQNRVYRVPEPHRYFQQRTSRWHFQMYRLSPILVKNLLRITRGKSRFVLILTSAFVLCGYLFSRNNQRLEDFLAILMTSVILYAIIFAYRSQHLLAAQLESTQILFALPIRRLSLYLSTLLPALLWMLLINSVFFILALTTETGLRQALFFGLKSFSLSAGFLIASMNFTFASYPNLNAAQKHFLYWGLSYLELMAVLFAYWYPIFIAMVGLSFLTITTRKLYRVF